MTRAYLAITKNSVLSNLAYRGHFLFMAAGNLVYIVVVRALWSSIYRGRDSINGMTFDQAFLYLVLAMSVFLLFQTWTEWFMAGRIRSGEAIIDFIRPLRHQETYFYDVTGSAAVNLIAITLPSILIVVLLYHAPLPLGWNLLRFAPALILAFLITFNLDYCVGLSAFYTESIWGISTAKEMLVLFLSGALIPLPFFPEWVRGVLDWLPFKAIYDTPLRILLSADMPLKEYLSLLGAQALWALALRGLSAIAFSRASRVLTVNGG